MQRLFSNFANGWPGAGLLLQRILTAILLVRSGVLDVSTTSPAFMVAQIAGACAGVLLLVGFWTPIVGALIAILEVSIAIAQAPNSLIPIILATLGATATMIGPGAWSIDAQLYGRKHIEP